MPRYRHLPFLVGLIFLLIAGGLTYQDYGLSWDEPLYYAYGAAVPYAYSISARLDGTFDIYNAYGPSAEDHKMYGPAYLLLGRPLVLAFSHLTSFSEYEQWRLVNFLTFLVGVVFLYKLSLRWLSPGGACFTSLLYATQPVLWGHAFINPKDSPFVTFFIISMYTGFKLVDVISAPGTTALEPSTVNVQAGWPRWRRMLMILGGLGLLALIIFYGFAPLLETMVSQAIEAVYHASPESLVGRWFARLAPNAASIPVSAYVLKGLVIFTRLQKISLIIALPLVLLGGLAAFFSKWLLRALTAWETSAHGPLPRLPTLRGHIPAAELRAGLPLALLVGVLLGVSTTLRILAPLAGVLALTYFLLRSEHRPIWHWLIVSLAALLSMYLTWPFLWDAPVARFWEVLTHMSFNPKSVPVLFAGVVHSSLDLPATYLPTMLTLTLSEPVWPFILIGGGWLIWAWTREPDLVRTGLHAPDARSFLPVLAWFGLPFVYVLLRRPPMYDGYRHFLFILPPVFILAGIGYQAVCQRIQRRWFHALLLTLLVLPGVASLVRLHPYQYTYYNSLVGGVGGAFRRFETDYWLTCYKEAMEQVNQQTAQATTIFALRQPSNAEFYADSRFNIQRFAPEADLTFPGSLLLLTTRSNRDLDIHPDDPLRVEVGRDGAIFCLVREIK